MTSNETSRASVILLKSLAGQDSLELQGEMIIGRGSACDLVIEEERLSRKHARLSVGDGSIVVEDLGSTNGTFVNDKKTDGPVLAGNNDIIKFDTFAYQVCVVGGVDDTEPTVSGVEALKDETIEAKTRMFSPPKSWALDESQSAEGTMMMTPDMLKTPSADGSGSAVLAEDINVDAPVLVCVSGDLKGKVFKFTTRDKLTKWEIGRAESCEVVIDDGSVSASHAQLIHEGKRWKLIDLMSANGTYVNGNKGLSSYLASGDKIRLGQVEFLFKLSGDDVSPEAAAVTSQTALSIPAWAIGAAAFVLTAAILYWVLG